MAQRFIVSRCEFFGLPHAPISEWLGCTDWAISKLIRTAEDLHRWDRDFRKDSSSSAANSLRGPLGCR